MTDITFHYNASTATTTAVGTVDGQITTYGNGSVWNAQIKGLEQIGNDGNFLHNGHMSILVGDTLYFDGDDNGQPSVGRELFAFNTSNETTWLVKDINPNFYSYSYGSDSHVGQYMHCSIGDTIYFNANDGSTGNELWAHNTTNQTTWQVADIYDGAISLVIPVPESHMSLTIRCISQRKMILPTRNYGPTTHQTSHFGRSPTSTLPLPVVSELISTWL